MLDAPSSLFMHIFNLFKGTAPPPYENSIPVARGVWGTELNSEGPRCVRYAVLDIRVIESIAPPMLLGE